MKVLRTVQVAVAVCVCVLGLSSLASAEIVYMTSGEIRWVRRNPGVEGKNSPS